MQNYPRLTRNDMSGVIDALRYIGRARESDITEFNNLNRRFIAGRKVDKIPSASSDVAESAVGDFNVTKDYAYFCVDDAGSAVWRRIALSAW